MENSAGERSEASVKSDSDRQMWADKCFVSLPRERAGLHVPRFYFVETNFTAVFNPLCSAADPVPCDLFSFSEPEPRPKGCTDPSVCKRFKRKQPNAENDFRMCWFRECGRMFTGFLNQIKRNGKNGFYHLSEKTLNVWTEPKTFVLVRLLCGKMQNDFMDILQKKENPLLCWWATAEAWLDRNLMETKTNNRLFRARPGTRRGRFAKVIGRPNPVCP